MSEKRVRLWRHESGAFEADADYRSAHVGWEPVEFVPLARLQASEQALAQAVGALERIAEMGDKVEDGYDGKPVIVLAHPRELEDAAAVARSTLTQLQPEESTP